MNKEGYDNFLVNYFPALQKRAIEQGLNAFTMFFHPDSPMYRDEGIYMIVCPNRQYEKLLKENPDYLERLIRNKEQNSSAFFDANYRVFDVSDFKGDGSDFGFIMNTMRAIDVQAVAINAFRGMGYSEFPTCIGEYSIYEIEKLEGYMNDPRVPGVVRDRYRESYKEFVGHVYNSAMEASHAHLIPISKSIFNSRRQRIRDKNFFIDRKVPMDCHQIGEEFRTYFEEAIKQFPQFYYYMPEKPTLHLKDVSKKYKGNPLNNVWKDEVEVKEWKVYFPQCYSEIFYGIVNQYNHKDLPGQAVDREQIGSDNRVVQIEVAEQDIANWANLASANNVKYYINRGDLAPITKDNCWDNNIIIVHEDDKDMAYAILNRLYNEFKDVRVIDYQTAAYNVRNIEGMKIRGEISDKTRTMDMDSYLGR